MDSHEAKLLFAALRAGEALVGCSSDDVLPCEVGPNGSGAWTIPVDDRYVIWVWTGTGHLPNSDSSWDVAGGGGRYEIRFRMGTYVYSAVSSTSADWVLGPFCSVDAIDAVHWAMDSTLDGSLETTRGRTLRLNQIRTLQRQQHKPAEPTWTFAHQLQVEDRLKAKKVSDAQRRLTHTGRPRKGNKNR